MHIEQRFLTVEINSNEDVMTAINTLKTEIQKNQSNIKEGYIVYRLPEPTIKLPKEKKIVEKEKTKWEIFAEKKEIAKTKKGFFIYDEATGEKKHRYGAKSEKNELLKNGVYSKGKSYGKLKKEKKERIMKNKINALKNLERQKAKKQ